MTKTNVGRLTELKEYWTGMSGTRSALGQGLDQEDEEGILWLIERVQKLIRTENEFLHSSKYLLNENKRLHSHLEEIRSYMEYDAEIFLSEQDRLDGIGKVLKKHYQALEVSE